MVDAIEGITSITSINDCNQYATIRAGGLSELKLEKEWELGLWAAWFLGRSATTLTTLDVRCDGLGIFKWGQGINWSDE